MQGRGSIVGRVGNGRYMRWPIVNTELWATDSSSRSASAIA